MLVSGYTLGIKTCAMMSASSNSGTSTSSTSDFTFSLSSTSANVTNIPFLVAPVSSDTLYEVGSDVTLSHDWTSVTITSATTDALCIEHIVVNNEIWVGTVWLNNPCGTATYAGGWNCHSEYTWQKFNFEVKIHLCDVNGGGGKLYLSDFLLCPMI